MDHIGSSLGISEAEPRESYRSLTLLQKFVEKKSRKIFSFEKGGFQAQIGPSPCRGLEEKWGGHVGVSSGPPGT